MFKIENDTIHITRGDIGSIEVTAKNDDNTDYNFQVGDVIRLSVYKKKDCNCVELQKDVTVSTQGTSVDLDLTSEDTKIEGIIDKPVTYYFEITLNPDTNPQTIVAYDMDGAKEFILYPESADEQ